VVTINNVITLDVTPCGSMKTYASEERIASIITVERIKELGTTLAVFLRSVLQLSVTTNVVPSSLSLFTLMMEAIRSSETSDLTRAMRRHKDCLNLTSTAVLAEPPQSLRNHRSPCRTTAVLEEPPQSLQNHRSFFQCNAHTNNF
jgi:hypothetical protein